MGLRTQADPSPFYDLIIVGAGPAGLGAAVVRRIGGVAHLDDRPAGHGRAGRHQLADRKLPRLSRGPKRCRSGAAGRPPRPCAGGAESLPPRMWRKCGSMIRLATLPSAMGRSWAVVHGDCHGRDRRTVRRAGSRAADRSRHLLRRGLDRGCQLSRQAHLRGRRRRLRRPGCDASPASRARSACSSAATACRPACRST